jgi:hypothetical protein
MIEENADAGMNHDGAVGIDGVWRRRRRRLPIRATSASILLFAVTGMHGAIQWSRLIRNGLAWCCANFKTQK